MPELEDDLKLRNWLSILTFDVFKYAKVGGAVVVEWNDAGLTLHLPGVHSEDDGLNGKFKRAYALPPIADNGAIVAAPPAPVPAEPMDV